MAARALGISFRQALRSVALTLFPLAFIALFTWASAGSTAGNTSDPVRASAWLYLGAHLIPFTVPGGRLTVLPLLAVIYPMWAIRRGLPTVNAAFTKLNGARTIYSLWYALLSELLALLSIHHGVSANLYLTPLMTFVIAMLATADYQRRRLRSFYFALYLVTITLGIGALAFAFSLAEHLNEMKSVSVVLGVGTIGGILLVLLQLLYLPNIALAAISYLTGIGFSFGAHSLISGSQVAVGQVPALPFVTALPTGMHPHLKYGVGLWILLFALLMIFHQLRPASIPSVSRKILVEGVRLFLALAAVAYFSAGELLVAALNPVGVIWWRFLAHVGAAFGIAVILALYLPAVLRRVAHRG